MFHRAGNHTQLAEDWYLSGITPSVSKCFLPLSVCARNRRSWRIWIRVHSCRSSCRVFSLTRSFFSCSSSSSLLTIFFGKLFIPRLADMHPRHCSAGPSEPTQGSSARPHRCSMATWARRSKYGAATLFTPAIASCLSMLAMLPHFSLVIVQIREAADFRFRFRLTFPGGQHSCAWRESSSDVCDLWESVVSERRVLPSSNHMTPRL